MLHRRRSTENYSVQNILIKISFFELLQFPGSKRFTIQMMRDELNKVDPVAVSMDPYFASYLNDELLAVPDSKQNPGVFLERYIRSINTKVLNL